MIMNDNNIYVLGLVPLINTFGCQLNTFISWFADIFYQMFSFDYKDYFDLLNVYYDLLKYRDSVRLCNLGALALKLYVNDLSIALDNM